MSACTVLSGAEDRSSEERAGRVPPSTTYQCLHGDSTVHRLRYMKIRTAWAGRLPPSSSVTDTTERCLRQARYCWPGLYAVLAPSHVDLLSGVDKPN